MKEVVIPANTIRPAHPDDAQDLANLVVMAGDGMPLLVWDQMREGTETVMEVGRRRAAREVGGFSYRHADVVVRKGQVISALISYPLAERTPLAAFDDIPPMFRPLVELENEVVGTWYINVLASYPDFRGSGAASALLNHVESCAKSAGYDALSLITGNINPALAFYERRGFQDIGRRKIVKENWDYEGREWVLLHKRISSGSNGQGRRAPPSG